MLGSCALSSQMNLRADMMSRVVHNPITCERRIESLAATLKEFNCLKRTNYGPPRPVFRHCRQAKTRLRAARYGAASLEDATPLRPA
jgi:hypothetical protein